MEQKTQLLLEPQSSDILTCPVTGDPCDLELASCNIARVLDSLSESDPMISEDFIEIATKILFRSSTRIADLTKTDELGVVVSSREFDKVCRMLVTLPILEGVVLFSRDNGEPSITLDQSVLTEGCGTSKHELDERSEIPLDAKVAKKYIAKHIERGGDKRLIEDLLNYPTVEFVGPSSKYISPASGENIMTTYPDIKMVKKGKHKDIQVDAKTVGAIKTHLAEAVAGVGDKGIEIKEIDDYISNTTDTVPSLVNYSLEDIKAHVKVLDQEIEAQNFSTSFNPRAEQMAIIAKKLLAYWGVQKYRLPHYMVPKIGAPIPGFIYESGACLGVGGELFAPGPNDDTSKNEKVCGSCPVKPGCLDWAVETRQEGYWGGASHRERMRIANARRNAATSNNTD